MHLGTKLRNTAALLLNQLAVLKNTTQPLVLCHLASQTSGWKRPIHEHTRWDSWMGNHLRRLATQEIRKLTPLTPYQDMIFPI